MNYHRFRGVVLFFLETVMLFLQVWWMFILTIKSLAFNIEVETPTNAGNFGILIDIIEFSTFVTFELIFKITSFLGPPAHRVVL